MFPRRWGGCVDCWQLPMSKVCADCIGGEYSPRHRSALILEAGAPIVQVFPVNRACKTTFGWQTPAGDDKLTGGSDPRLCIARCRAFCLSGDWIYSDRSSYAVGSAFVGLPLSTGQRVPPHPSRRLQAARQAPRRAAPCQDRCAPSVAHPLRAHCVRPNPLPADLSGPPDCLRELRQTGSVASFECSTSLVRVAVRI